MSETTTPNEAQPASKSQLFTAMGTAAIKAAIETGREMPRGREKASTFITDLGKELRSLGFKWRDQTKFDRLVGQLIDLGLMGEFEDEFKR